MCLIEVPWEPGYEVRFDGVIGQSTGSSVLDDNGLNDQVHHKVASHEVAVPHGLTYIISFFGGQKAPQQLWATNDSPMWEMLETSVNPSVFIASRTANDPYDRCGRRK